MLQYLVLRRAKNNFVRSDSILCLEGFPRSGNSFASILVALGIEGAMYAMAGQTHAIANIKRAVRLGVPTFVVVREPLDCCSSFVLYGGCTSLEDALRAYHDFHKWLIPIADRITIIPFDYLTSSPQDVVRRVAQAVGRNVVERQDDVVEAAKASMVSWNRTVLQDVQSRYSLPHEHKKLRKAALLESPLSAQATRLLARNKALKEQLFAASVRLDGNLPPRHTIGRIGVARPVASKLTSIEP